MNYEGFIAYRRLDKTSLTKDFFFIVILEKNIVQLIWTRAFVNMIYVARKKKCKL